MDSSSEKTNNKYNVIPLGEKLLNPIVKEYRLTKKQRLFYTELFNENSSNGKVKRENFFPLLGILGTQISQEFSDRMFLALSRGQPEITLDQYLNYIDAYYYGDIHERCLYICRFMDTDHNEKIELKEFQSYLNLIINTVRRVNNTLTKTILMSDKDIELLFFRISKGKAYFTYYDFEIIYQEKPELVTWFDYFKNDKQELLLIINENIEIILNEIYSFLLSFMKDIFLLLDKEKEINLENIFQKVLNYNNRIENIISSFIDKISKFKMTSAFALFQADHKRNFIYDLPNKIFDSEYHPEKKINIDKNKSINELFKTIRTYLHNKDSKEIIFDNKLKKPDTNDKWKWNNFINKFLKRSKNFRDKNIKFNDKKDLNLSNISKIQNLNEDLNKSVDNLKDIHFIDNNNKKGTKINDINNLNLTPINNHHKMRNIYNSPDDNYNINNNININNYNENNNINQNYINNFNTYNNDNNISQNNQNYKIPSIGSFSESQKLKQLLFFSRVAIEKSLESNIIINNCYKWISENYLSKPINKIKKEEKLKRKISLKRKSSKLNKSRKLVPLKKKIIGASEKSFEILFNMIMGIQIAVQAIPNFKIKNRDDMKKYLTSMLYSIQTVYLGKENEKIYLLKEFGGVIFNNIRIYFGINKESFIKSISPQDFVTELMISFQTIFEELCSTGSSGSLLYYTRDGEFIVKTISRKEYKFLKKILGEYYFYIKDNPLSFLPKLLGCYVLKKKYKKKITNIYFIVMANVFSTSKNIDVRFDLKGSKIGRRVIKRKHESSDNLQIGDMALKDLDFEEIGEKVNVGAEKREMILEQFKKDIEFLYSINSNDYSLLLGIHYVKDADKSDILKSFPMKNIDEKINDPLNVSLFTNTYETESKTSSKKEIDNRMNCFKKIYDFEDFGILSENHKRIYYLGIIDILTEYGCSKRLEYLFKKIRYCSNDMSCIPPFYYKERFYNYLNEVFSKEEKNYSQQMLINKDNNKQILHNDIDIYSSINSSRYNKEKKEYKNNDTEESIQNL